MILLQVHVVLFDSRVGGVLSRLLLNDLLLFTFLALLLINLELIDG